MRVAAGMAVPVTEVRNNFRQFIDDVIRRGPQSLKRHQDVVFAISAEHLQAALGSIQLTMVSEREPDGSYTGHLEQVDLVANAESPDELKQALAQDLIVYAEDYMKDFATYYHAPNRRQHLPIVLKVLAVDKESLPELINAQLG